MRSNRELLHSPLALATLLGVVLTTTACTACTPPGPDNPSASTARGSESARPDQADQGSRKQLPPPPASQMIREAPGVDLSALSETQRASFFTVINTEPSACDKPHSLATSLRDDPECRNSMIVAQFIADRLASGATPSDVKLDVDEVVDALTAREIPTEGRPLYGNERAPVTVVVFADFECPHCRAEAPTLRKAVQRYRGQIKLVYMHYPLEMHPRAKVAAVAAEAAHAQGKFWEMHDLIFDHQHQLEDEDLERYAKQIDGLDLGRWKADFAAEAAKLAVAKDRAIGDALDIRGTPAVYVDGRALTRLLWGGNLDAWIDDALRR
jgi:protein-disulfide isomerase